MKSILLVLSLALLGSPNGVLAGEGCSEPTEAGIFCDCTGYLDETWTLVNKCEKPFCESPTPGVKSTCGWFCTNYELWPPGEASITAECEADSTTTCTKCTRPPEIDFLISQGWFCGQVGETCSETVVPSCPSECLFQRGNQIEPVACTIGE